MILYTSMKKLILIFIMFVFSGCSGVYEFSRPYLSVGREADKFSVLNSISFQYRSQTINALGYTTVDRISRSYSVTALSPTGIKLFQMEYQNGTLNKIYMMDELKDFGDASDAVAGDIARIYFHTSDARYFYDKTGYRLKYKEFVSEGRTVCKVQYSDYKYIEGRYLPCRILLRDNRYRYTLLVITKETGACE